MTIFTPGSSQTPGTYVVPVLDTGIGAGATVSITVAANGTVTAAPIVLTAGSNYQNPYITFSEGGTPATFVVTMIAVLTLDRDWMDPGVTNANYLAYQCYFAAPSGWRRWYSIVDVIDNYPLDWWSYTQISLSEADPQRTYFAQPEYAVYFSQDVRQGSSTYGQALWELWNGPITQLSYWFMCQCDYPLLVNPNDTVPFPLTEELVKFRAMECLALWKESQRGDDMERGSGANWQFLAQAYRKEYELCLKPIRIKDRNITDLYFQKMRRQPAMIDAFVSVNSQMNVGS